MTIRVLPFSPSVIGLAALCVINACVATGPGAASVLETTTAIPAGADCPAGGSAVSIGHDLNGNGFLDAGEVEQVTNVCNREVPPTLTRVEVEPAGDHCASDGRVVKAGPDLNRNGKLDENEVTSTTYACDASDVFFGDFTADMWNNPAQVAALVQARVVTGTLTLASDANVSLPRLAMIGGDLTIAPGAPPASIDLSALIQISGSLLALASNLDALALPALATVGGSVQIDTASDLGRLSLPALTTVGQDVLVLDTPLLATAGLPVLSKVGGAVALVNAPVLQDVDLPALTAVSRMSVSRTGAIRVSLPGPVTLDSLVIADNAALAQIGLPRLVRASQVQIVRDTTLRQLDLGSLVASDRAAGALDSLDIEFTALDALDLPIGTTAGRIVIANNRGLTSLRLARLISASGLIVQRCPALVTLEAPQLFEVDDLTLAGPLTSLSLPSSLWVHHALSWVSTGLAHLPPARLDPRASLSVSSNPALADLRGLDLPAELSSVSIWSNPLVTSLTGLESIAQLQTLQVGDNAALVDLTGLASLVQADDIELRLNAAMTSLQGLDRLSSLTNSLRIMDEPALVSLDGLDALENIGGALVVTRNPELASLDGLSALQSVGLAYGTVNGGPSFYVVDNAALSPDAIAALLARIRHN
jgi:hypothetical protein